MYFGAAISGYVVAYAGVEEMFVRLWKKDCLVLISWAF